mmetsp:Transcript_65948/g.193380  ORF Transcript_65948/g.193380 Transcript_65948/m.193380 type:complete len:349 (+) Transcript_65948:2020-3066(+)
MQEDLGDLEAPYSARLVQGVLAVRVSLGGICPGSQQDENAVEVAVADGHVQRRGLIRVRAQNVHVAPGIQHLLELDRRPLGAGAEEVHPHLPNPGERADGEAGQVGRNHEHQKQLAPQDVRLPFRALGVHDASCAELEVPQHVEEPRQPLRRHSVTVLVDVAGHVADEDGDGQDQYLVRGAGHQTQREETQGEVREHGQAAVALRHLHRGHRVRDEHQGASANLAEPVKAVRRREAKVSGPLVLSFDVAGRVEVEVHDGLRHAQQGQHHRGDVQDARLCRGVVADEAIGEDYDPGDALDEHGVAVKSRRPGSNTEARWQVLRLDLLQKGLLMVLRVPDTLRTDERVEA